MSLNLFDKILRDNTDPAEYGEPEFTYVNRTARKHYISARETLEEWFSEYTRSLGNQPKDLRSRFRKPDNQHHLGALTELYLHHLLLENGYTVTGHPKLSNTSHRPEFLVLQNGKPCFITEAVLVFGKENKNRSQKFESSVLDAINKIQSSDYLVSASFKVVNHQRQPPYGKIKRKVEKWLLKLDYAVIYNQYKATKDVSSLSWNEEGWHIEFRAVPVREEVYKHGVSGKRMMGAIVYPIRNINIDEEIKEKVSEKAKKYGMLDLPYLIVVNVASESIFCDNYSIMSALFGRETISFPVPGIDSDSDHKGEWGRTMDGAWIHPQAGIQNTRVSGLMVIPGLTAATLHDIHPVLWHHPTSRYSLDANFLKIDQRIHNPETGRMEELKIGIQ